MDTKSFQQNDAHYRPQCEPVYCRELPSCQQGRNQRANWSFLGRKWTCSFFMCKYEELLIAKTSSGSGQAMFFVLNFAQPD